VSDPPRYCAGALILDDAGRIFIQRRSAAVPLFAGCWDIVGGHLEPGESAQEALRREIAEETGWALSHILADLGEIEYVGDDGVRRVEQDFLVRVEGDLRKPRLAPAEHTEWRWIDRTEAGAIGEPGANGHRRPGDELTQRLIGTAFAVAREIGLA
jgi:8-oxo-dGTP pyrophosphatase MutT (NUDIX family)